MAIPLLEGIDIQGKDVSADALLTQRQLAEYLVTERQAHYHFTVKETSPEFFRIWSYTSRIGNNRSSLSMRPRITDESKPERSGQPRISTATLTFLTLDKPLSSSGIA